jgi:diguanylate cyclase (GGDEF)-like protein/PAS domain S-box-containing protein
MRAVHVGGVVSVTWRDVTDRYLAAQALATREGEFRLLADNVSDVVMRLSRGVIEWVSPSVSATLGGCETEWLGSKLMHRVHPDDVSDYMAVGEQVREGQIGRWRGRLKSLADEYRWVEIHVGPYSATTGHVAGSVLSLRVVEDQVAAERELERLARTDPLTGALNRREALDRLNAALRNVRRPGPDVAVVFCDIDKFKTINDTYGHIVGDHVLVTLVQRITARLRAEDVVARMGGDELLMVLSGIHGIEEAERIADAVSRCADDPIHVGDVTVTASMSIGVTIGQPTEGADSVVSRADNEMYRRKTSRVKQLPSHHSSR